MVFNNSLNIGKIPQGSWSRGYDGALTRRRSPVQFRPGPLLVIALRISKFYFTVMMMVINQAFQYVQ